MLDETSPRRPRVGADCFGQIAERFEREVPVVGVVATEVGQTAAVLARLELPRVLQTVGLPERALVKEVVTTPGVAHRCLRAERTQRRMRVELARVRRPAGIRDAELADATVVVGNIVEQPL